MSHAGHHSELDYYCIDCKLRYHKEYTWKQWCNFRKLDSKKLIGDKEYYLSAQEVLCRKYTITLTDYMTPREREIQMIKIFFEKIKSTLQGIKSVLAKVHESNQ